MEGRFYKLYTKGKGYFQHFESLSRHPDATPPFPFQNEVAWHGDMWHVANDGDRRQQLQSICCLREVCYGRISFFAHLRLSVNPIGCEGKGERTNQEHEMMHVITSKVYPFGQ